MKLKNRLLSWIMVSFTVIVAVGFHEASAEANNQSIFIEANTGMEFLLVKGGCFDMGNNFDRGDKDEKPVHRVCLDDFYIGTFEVSVGEYLQFVTETGYKTEAEKGKGCFGRDKTGNYSVVKDKSWNNLSFAQQKDHPVVCVSWNDAQAFVNWLNQKSGGSFRLLTEAEWEYAARSRGKKQQYATKSGELTSELANFGPEKCCGPEGADGHLHTAPGGSYPANDIGVYDMSGNVWEWIADWYDENYYSHSRKFNPRGPDNGSFRIIRGGSWSIPGRYSRCSNRRKAKALGRHVNTGFRLAKDAHK